VALVPHQRVARLPQSDPCRNATVSGAHFA
jgi:hypothetical protein